MERTNKLSAKMKKKYGRAREREREKKNYETNNAIKL